MFKEKDTRCVIAVLSVIAIIMICLMIYSFKWIDFIYFLIVISTAVRYLQLSKE